MSRSQSDSRDGLKFHVGWGHNPRFISKNFEKSNEIKEDSVSGGVSGEPHQRLLTAVGVKYLWGCFGGLKGEKNKFSN